MPEQHEATNSETEILALLEFGRDLRLGPSAFSELVRAAVTSGTMRSTAACALVVGEIAAATSDASPPIPYSEGSDVAA